ncbi:PREDICTED: odorant receptor 4-like isoform X2 [Vollenhovia emeryi]|uniref:odorant receptor 4-like isoform X2 n=1 Tax=Vollenhovia emeryi TaxID=411798 RepID=UPI0005F3A4F1|nr:PREDICTED: odorant receptor 4-like isoform X2 [Vollenhovia emeryi]
MVCQNPLNRTIKFMLTLSGTWPGASCILPFRTFLVVSVIVTTFCNLRYFMIHMYTGTLGNFIDCLSIIFAHFKVLFKCLTLWFNQRKFIEILNMMREDWNDCTNNDVSMRITASKAKSSERITYVIAILQTLSVLGYSSGPLLANIDVTNNTTEILFITKMEVPFDINTQRTYRLLLMAECFTLFIYSWSAGAINCLLLILTLHIAGQIDIVCYWLTHVAPSGDENKDESITIATTKIIQKHKKIIRFSNIVETLFAYITLMQFVLNTIMICALAFLVVSAIGTPDMKQSIVKCFFFYIATNLEAYIFCFSGEHLQNKSKEISLAAYNSAWYGMKLKDSRILLFIILISQKPLTLTIGKMTDLSLQSFTKIMNASGSYLSILLAMR